MVTIFDVASGSSPRSSWSSCRGNDRRTDERRTGSAGARSRVAGPGGASTRCGARRGSRPSRRQAGEPDAGRRRRAARHRLRDRPDRGRRLADEHRHGPRHLGLHVARTGRRRHGHPGERPLRARRRGVRAAERPQAVPGGDLRSGGRRSRDGRRSRAATPIRRLAAAAIDAVFERGSRQAPEERFRSCGELVAALRDRRLGERRADRSGWRSAGRGSTRPAPVWRQGSSSRARGLLLALLAALALLGLLPPGSRIEATRPRRRRQSCGRRPWPAGSRGPDGHREGAQPAHRARR